MGVAHLGSAYTRPAHTLSPDLVQRTAHTRLRHSRTRGAKSAECCSLPRTEGVEVGEVEDRS